MTDTDTALEPADDQVETPTRPARPPSRQRPARRAPEETPTHPNGMPDALAIMQRLEALERQQGQYVPQAPAALPQGFTADPEAAATPLLRKLVERTGTTPVDYRPGTVSYNHPHRFYCRPDGDVVELQGSPECIAMYLDLGFALLSTDETKQWLEHDRAIVLKDQRERARLINAIRDAAKVEPKLAYAVSPEAETDMQHMTTSELRARAKAVVGEDLKHFARPQRLIDAEERAAERRDKRTMSGVEKGSSIDEVRSKMERASLAGRPPQGHAFNPDRRSLEALAGQPINHTY